MSGWSRLADVLDGGPLRRRRRFLLAAAIASLAITLALLSPLLSARWSLVDDHETIAFYDSSSSHGPDWYFDSLAHSETGRPGQGTRFRPIYFMVRLAETGLYGGSARMWWITHMFMFALGVFFTLVALRRLTGVWETLLATLWLVGSFTWWGDIFCRLGPSEAYCVPALALYSWGAIAAEQTMRSGGLRRYHAWCGAALAIGGVVAAGCKENFFFLLVPSAYLLVRARWRGSRRWVTVGAALQIVMGLFVLIAAFVGVARFGHVYKDDASAGGLVHMLSYAAKDIARTYWLYMLLGVAALSSLLFFARDRRTLLARQLAMPVAMLLTAYGVWISQVAFYGGWPPVAGRYRLPASLAWPLVLYAGYLITVRTARFFDSRAALLLRALVLVFMAWTVAHLDFSVRTQATKMRATSLDFAKKLHRIVKQAHAHPTAPVICVANTVEAYELVDSLQVFLRHAHVTNPVYMIDRFTPAQFPPGSLNRSLAEQMEKAARDGTQGLFPLTLPFAYQADGGACIAVGFNGATVVPGCTTVATF